MHEKRHSEKSYSVVQLGARMHYAVPTLFHESGRLDEFITDFWYPNFKKKLPAWHLISPFISKTSFGRAMNARNTLALRDAPVTSFDFRGIKYSRDLSRAKSREEQTRLFLEMGSWFTKHAAQSLSENTVGLYAFNSVALELFNSSKFKHTHKVLEQTLAPRKTENSILREEYKKRGLDYPADPYTSAYEEREIKEWDAADLILCGSDFVKNAMIDLGADASKISVVPYGVDFESRDVSLDKNSETLQILFAGNGGIRKGLPYLLEAVQSFGEHVTLHIAGNPDLPDEMMKDYSNVIFHGVVPRSEMKKLYSQCDVFALPSLCEGSATVIYEAMAQGLAIVTTPNSGSVIRDAKEGRIIPVSDSKALREVFQLMLDEPDTLYKYRQEALKTSGNYGLEEYKSRVLSAI